MADVFEIGNIVELKKNHPCGSNSWEIIRKGADFKIKCLGCGHIVMIERHKLEKLARRIMKTDN